MELVSRLLPRRPRVAATKRVQERNQVKDGYLDKGSPKNTLLLLSRLISTLNRCSLSSTALRKASDRKVEDHSFEASFLKSIEFTTWAIRYSPSYPNGDLLYYTFFDDRSSNDLPPRGSFANCVPPGKILAIADPTGIEMQGLSAVAFNYLSQSNSCGFYYLKLSSYEGQNSTFRGAMNSLIYQIANELESELREAVNFAQKPGILRGKQKSLESMGLSKIINLLVEAFSLRGTRGRQCLFIDGLDELKDDKEIRNILDAIQAVASSTEVGVFLNYRPHKSITREVKSWGVKEIVTPDALVKRQSTKEIDPLTPYPCGSLSRHEIPYLLRHLRPLEHIRTPLSEDPELTGFVFELLMAAQEPLTVTQIIDATRLYALSVGYRHVYMYSERDLEYLCGPYIKIHKDKTVTYTDRFTRIYFPHEDFKLRDPKIHYMIAMLCLYYLLEAGNGIKIKKPEASLSDQFPFLLYAARHCIYHIESALDIGTSIEKSGKPYLSCLHQGINQLFIQHGISTRVALDSSIETLDELESWKFKRLCPGLSLNAYRLQPHWSYCPHLDPEIWLEIMSAYTVLFNRASETKADYSPPGERSMHENEDQPSDSFYIETAIDARELNLPSDSSSICVESRTDEESGGGGRRSSHNYEDTEVLSSLQVIVGLVIYLGQARGFWDLSLDSSDMLESGSSQTMETDNPQCSSTVSTGQSPSSQAARAKRGRSGPGSQLGKRPRRDEGGDGCDLPPSSEIRQIEELHRLRRLACPFAKANPDDYVKCWPINRGEYELAGIKEHIVRYHHIPSPEMSNIKTWEALFEELIAKVKPSDWPLEKDRPSKYWNFEEMILNSRRYLAMQRRQAEERSATERLQMNSMVQALEAIGRADDVVAELHRLTELVRQAAGPALTAAEAIPATQTHSRWSTRPAQELWHLFSQFAPGVIQTASSFPTVPALSTDAEDLQQFQLMPSDFLGYSDLGLTGNEDIAFLPDLIYDMGATDLFDMVFASSEDSINSDILPNPATGHVFPALQVTPGTSTEGSKQGEGKGKAPDTNFGPKKYTLYVKRRPVIKSLKETPGRKTFEFDTIMDFGLGFEGWLHENFLDPLFTWNEWEFYNPRHQENLTTFEEIREALEYEHASGNCVVAFDLIRKG
ncbi:hypothetical protein ABW19_dt0201616 [Dactylella cylindrospora]|nr:hypothetical protein ABW19_dt0201616 [Dactylella cylindrospora]